MTSELTPGQSIALGLPRSAAPGSHPALFYLLSLSPGSRRAQACALRDVARFLGFSPGALPWQSLTLAELVGVRAWIAERYAPATANRMLCAVRGVLRACVSLRLMARDDGAELASITKKVKGSRGLRGRHVTQAELAALFGVLDQTSPLGRRDAALLALLYGCGLRRAELAALDLEDVTAEGLRVVGKGDQERIVPLPSSVRATLERWIWELACRRDTRVSPALFPCVHASGHVRGRIGTMGIYDRVRGLAKRAGIPSISPHDLRRSYVSDLLDRKVDLATVQALVGHADPVVTARYDRRPARARAEAVECLTVPGAPRITG